MTKKIAKIGSKGLIAIAFSLFLLPQIAAANFSDVPVNHPQYEAINYLFEKGTVNGFDDGTFHPDELIKTVEFIAMAFRNIGYEPGAGLHSTPFTDVPADSWFAPYIAKAIQLNLLKVNPEFPRLFPVSPIARIDGFKFIAYLEGIPAPYITNTGTTSFQDVTNNLRDWYLIKAAENSGVFIAEDFPNFFPSSRLTRGDAAELLYKASVYRTNQGTELPLPFEILEESGELITDDADLVNDPTFPLLITVWSKINEDFIDRDLINNRDLIYGAIDGMVRSLDDPHSDFVTPNEAPEFEQLLDGTYEGIGTVLDTFDDRIVIISVIPGSPAEAAGLQSGDIIEKINGIDVSNLDIEEIITRLKGPAGTTVDITVDRNGIDEVFEVTRQEITLDTVLFDATNSTDIPESIGYIAIYQFTKTTGREFADILATTLESDPHGLIIDLRDNPGGFVSSAYEVLELFLEKGQIMTKIKMGGRFIDEEAQRTGDALEADMPIIILVNEASASAAEIVAGALQEHGKAVLIGEQTFGKGTVQEVNIYDDGSLFKLTVAEWFTPNDVNIDGVGITPDITAATTKDDILGLTDSQLELAIREIQKM